MGFDVKPVALDTSARDLHQMGIAIESAQAYAATYLQRQWDGGVFLADAGSVVNEVESNARSSYHRNAHQLDRAATVLRATADAYRDTDRTSAAASDKLIEQTGPLYEWGDEKPEYAETGRGLKQSDVAGVLKDPGNRNDGVQAFLDLEDKVKKIIALGHEADKITALGFKNPFVGWADDWEGEWSRMGVAAAAMGTLGGFWIRVGGEVDATRAFLGQRWDGHAANAAREWFNLAGHECYEHGWALKSMGDEVFYKGLLMNDAISAVLELAADLVDLVTSAVELVKQVGEVNNVMEMISNPLGQFGQAYDVARQALDFIRKVEALLKHVVKAITVARATGEIFVAMLADWGSPSDSINVQTAFFPPLTDLPGSKR